MTSAAADLAETTPVQSGWQFWSAVRAEMRATWGRRYRLWTALVILLELVILGLYMPGIGGLDGLRIWLNHTPALAPAYVPLLLLFIFWPLLLVWLGAAALGADLLSLNFRENPEPHREWHAVEFLARAVGRWAPWLLMGLLWLGTWIGMELWARSMQPVLTGSRAPIVDFSFMDWIAKYTGAVGLVLVVLLLSVPFAALAALLSASSRRPRRGRITLAVWLLMLLAAVGNQLFAFTASDLDLQRGLVYYTLLWVIETVGMLVGIWGITTQRYRRHPYTKNRSFPEAH